MPAGPCSHGARVGHGTSDIEDRVLSRLTVKLGCPQSYVGSRPVDTLAPPLGSWVALAIMLTSPRKRGTLFVQVVCTHVQVDRVQVDCPLCKLIVQVGCAS